MGRFLRRAERTAAAGSGTVAKGGLVVNHSLRDDGYRRSHEGASHLEIARRLAALIGFDHAGWHDPAAHSSSPIYLVSSDTLAADLARALNIQDVHDLFGGVVPYDFVGTKVITHPLLAPTARAAAGWSHAFAEWVAEAVLCGFSVFSLEDARLAGARLLEHGPVRLKSVRGIGGRGQVVVADAPALEAALGAMDMAEIHEVGLVLEEHLEEVLTLSVGQVQVGELVASYHGTQRLTGDRTGAEVYGGSTLQVVRGSFEQLLATDLAENVRRAVEQARAYDLAAHVLFPGFFSSRRNYDVAQGRNAQGAWRSGVLEQSWRIGGASGAEIAALEAFHADPALTSVQASTFEFYGKSDPPPGDAIYFNGIDEGVGQILKYTLIGTT
jgi:hypothetical protein